MHPSDPRRTVLADRFELELVAGRGGMGSVWRAHDRATGRPVAVKVLHAEDADALRRFDREARMLAELEHEAIVRYVAHGLVDEAQPFLALEWLDGPTLAATLEQRALSVAEAVDIGRRIASALAAAHARGIVHRDIKPSNVVLRESLASRATLLDFGIAFFTGSTALTRTGAIVGTPAYTSPEQARGEPHVGPASDLFSLGSLLFKCLTGRAPFTGEDMLAVLLKVVFEEVPSPSTLRPGIPPALDDLVARLLSKAATARPASAAAVASELASIATEPGAGGGAARRVLGGAEQRLTCLVLVGADRSAEAALAAVAKEHDARAAALAHGSHAIALSADRPAVDWATRAARAGLAVRDRVPRARVAVATGRTSAVGPDGDSTRAVTLAGSAEGSGIASRDEAPSAASATGEVIERGVALLARAKEGEVRIDAALAPLVGDLVELSRDDRGLIAIAERESPEPARTLLGRSTPFVGRDGELAMLDALWAEAADEPAARVVVVTGPPGAGKSRLRHELVRRVRERQAGAQIWIARGDPMHAGSPFRLAGQALRRAAGVHENDPPAVRRNKVVARVALRVPASDARRVGEFACEMAGCPVPDEAHATDEERAAGMLASAQLAAARADARLMGDQLKRAWVELVGAEAAHAPILLVLEDLHWGDAPTVRLVDAALAQLQRTALLVLVLARPELAQTFPRVFAERDPAAIALRSLSRSAATRLAREVLGEGARPEVIERLVEQAGGNAFFLEELIRAAAERDDASAAPESVLAMLEARVGALEPEARRVLRAASVFGQVFQIEGAAALLGSGTDVASWVRSLEAREMLSRRDDRQIAFRHALVREAAYAMLTDDDRKLGHGLAAEWLEAAGQADPIALAEHHERAGAPGRALGFHHRAARLALDGNDLAGAIEHARRAVLCGARAGRWPEPRDDGAPEPPPPGDGTRNEALGDLLLSRAEAHIWRGDLTETGQLCAHALAWLPRGSARWFDAAGTGAMAAGKRGQRDLILQIVRDMHDSPVLEGARRARVRAMAKTTPPLLESGVREQAARLLAEIDKSLTEHPETDAATLGRVAEARAFSALYDGDSVAYLGLAREAAEWFERAGDERNSAVQRGNIGFALVEVGHHEEAEEALRAVLATSRRAGVPNIEAAALENLGLCLARRGKLDEALAVESSAIQAFQLQHDRRMEAAARIYRAHIHELAGRLDEAEREAALAAEVGATTPPLLTYALAQQASALLALGRAAEARAVAERSTELLESLGGIEAGEALVRLVHAEALAATGEAARAREAIETARRRLEERAAKIRDPELRARFLAAIPEHRRTLDLAQGAATAL